MLLILISGVVTVVFVLGVFLKHINAVCKSRRRLDGRTTIVTGGTDGMGLQIAIDFAKRGARVIIACPFPEEGADALKTIIYKSGNKDVEFKHLNFASLKSVRQFASDILNTETRLDILVNNAGTAVNSDRLSKDGMNFVMQVNYYGQFLLTVLLLPLLRQTGQRSEPSRIVNTGSILHTIGHLNIDEFNKILHKRWVFHVYGASKLALLSFNFELARRLKDSNVVVNAVDPGAVGTNIFFGISWYLGWMAKICFWCISKTPLEGAQTAIHVALDEEAGRTNGGYFNNCRLYIANKRAYNEDIAKLLWKHSAKMVELTEGEIDSLLKGDRLDRDI